MSGDFWVCFREAERKLWYMKFLKKGFSHCFAVSISCGLYVKYEHGHGESSVEVINDIEPILNGCIIVKFNQSKPMNSLFNVNSCVGFVKSVIGLDSYSLTPYQLYKRLS